MWYGRLATTSYGGSTRSDEVLVERVALDEPERSRRPSKRSRRKAARPRSSSTAVTVGAGRRAGRAVRRPRPGPISRTRRPGGGSASARIASSTSGSARKFCDSAWRARSPAARSVARTAAGSTRGAVGRAFIAAASGSDGRASRSSPARSPAANRRAPAAPIIAPLSVHSAGRGTISGRPRASASPASRARRARSPRPRRRARSSARPISSAARIVFVDEHVDDRVLEAPRELGDDVVGERRLGRVGQAGVGARLGDDPAGRRLEAREAEVVRVAEPRPREDPVAAGRGLGRPRDRRPARVAEPEQPPDLVERLAGGVVDGRPEQPVGQVVAHLGEEGVAARDDQRDEREDRVGAVRLAGVAQPRRVDVALEVVDPDERPVVDPGERLGEVDPDEQRAREARAVGDRDGVDVVPGRAGIAPRLVEDRARSSAGGPGRPPRGRSRRSARGARPATRRRWSGSAGRPR